MKLRSVIVMSVPLALYLVSLFLPGIILKDGDFSRIGARSYDDAVQVIQARIQSGARCVTPQGDIALNDQGILIAGSKPLIQATNRSPFEWPNWSCERGHSAHSPYMGFDLLWIGIFGSLAWFANPIGWGALGLGYLALAHADQPFMKQVMILVSGLSAVAAFLIGLKSYALFIIERYDHGGISHYVVDRLGPGFYLWESSFALLAAIQVIAFILNFVARRRVSTP